LSLGVLDGDDAPCLQVGRTGSRLRGGNGKFDCGVWNRIRQIAAHAAVGEQRIDRFVPFAAEVLHLAIAFG
jgi:hypothetical protein